MLPLLKPTGTLEPASGMGMEEALRLAGHTPEGLIGVLAQSLGLAPTSAPIRPEELLGRFSMSQIPPASFEWEVEA